MPPSLYTYMHNSSCSSGFLQFIGLETPSEPVRLSYHGAQIAKEEEARAVMCLLRLSTFLGFFLLVLHFVSFLLAKLLSFLLRRAAVSQEPRHSLLGIGDEIKRTTGDDGRYFQHEELDAGIFRRDDGVLLVYNESAVNDSLLVVEEKGLTRRHLLEVDESFVAESPYSTPLNYNEHLLHDQYVNIPVTDVINPSDLPPAIIFEHGKDELEEQEEEMEVEVLSENQKCFAINQTHSESKNFEQEEDNEAFGGSLTGTGESSKSSAEWRNSAISMDSDTERPFSSSSRRSSNWETYSLFRKYDEEMMFFDRISSQKLAETESFRSIKFQPRSISQRITGKLTTLKKRMNKKNMQGGDPYQELENAYVAQICLAWEALNWNYNNFQQRNANSERFFCTAWVAQQFQQFQVLLQRFIENEPYESGRRPEVFARMRICFPKLLQVPELQNLEPEGGGENMISPAEFSGILEDAIRTFFYFLKADKKNPCQMLKALLIKRKSSSVDTSFLHLLKRANKKKKMRLKDMLKRSKYLQSKWVLEGGEEMEILMGLIDMKIVSRALRMSEVSQEQLHWCEEKMTKVRVWDGKIQRDSSPLFALFIHSNINALV